MPFDGCVLRGGPVAVQAASSPVPGFALSLPIMSNKSDPGSEPNTRKSEVERQAAERARRRAEQLRANLQRRKAQVRARREGRADETDGLPASEPD